MSGGSTRRRVMGGIAAIGIYASLKPNAVSAENGPLTVFVATSMYKPIVDIAGRFTQQTSVKVNVVPGSSAALARQIIASAPCDIFISANRLWLDEVLNEGIIQDKKTSQLATNALVVIAAKSASKPGLASLADLLPQLSRGRLAIGFVNSVPVGIYARQALSSAGIWDAVQSRLAEADNAYATLQRVATAQAPYGIVYATDAQLNDAIEVVHEIDPTQHDPIIYWVTAMQNAHPSSQEFLNALASKETMAKLESFGFNPVMKPIGQTQ